MSLTQVPLIIGEPFTELLSIDSTNSYALQQARSDKAIHGSVWLAHSQTAGRGQREKKWHSEEGLNINMSVLLDMQWMPATQQQKLNVAVSLAVFDIISDIVGGSSVSIKRPNDIYWNDKKCCGILIENILIGNLWKWAVVGIGINVNQITFDQSLPNPVSLKQITKQQYDIVLLAKSLCAGLQSKFTQLRTGNYDALFSLYESILYKG